MKAQHQIYNENFYSTMDEDSIYAANTILDIALQQCGTISSAIDVGCGVGTWSRVLYDKGISICCIDGPWVPEKFLVIPEKYFKSIELEKDLKKRERERERERERVYGFYQRPTF